MMKFELKTGRVAGLATVLWIVGSAPLGWAQVNITFEAPPYVSGNLIGQDGWVQNGYVVDPFFGGPNGTVAVSTATPLAGARSLLYNQTSVTGVGGGIPGASDVGKAGVITISAGVQGADLSVSYLISAAGNVQNPDGNAGLILSHTLDGPSPIFVRLNGSVMQVGNGGVISEIPDFVYFAGDRLEVTYDVDFDTSTFVVSVDNLTTGQFEFTSDPFAFLGGPTSFVPEGPNGEFLVDVGAVLRSGTAKIDNISLVQGSGAFISDLTWNVNASGNWNQSTNWNPGGVPGTNPGRQTAIFGGAITAPRTVFNNSNRSVNEVQFNNANSYVIAGTGSVSLQADTSGGLPVNPSIQVTAGNHQFQIAVNILDDTTVNVSGGASLTFNNQIDLGGNTLTLNGAVAINHSTIGGGMVLSTGALTGTGGADIGGDLVSTGALIVGVDADGADQFHVAGDATLSGILDVVAGGGLTPNSSYTVVSTGGSLDVSALALHPDDAPFFALSATGDTLTLSVLAAVPEPRTIGLATIGLIGLAGLRRTRARVASSLAAMVCLGAMAAARPAAAVNFTFENPPYTPGALIGQDGWIGNGYVLADPFFGGVRNGTVDVSASSPLGGSQSVLYTQTSDPPGSGGPGASDVGRPFSVFGVEDGTTAVDVTTSVLLRTDANAVGPGSIGFFLGEGGRSPIIVLISGTNVLVGDGGGLPAAGAYVANNTFEFTIGVDLDNSNYEVFSRNVTAGGAAVQLLGSGPGGRFPYFGGGFPDDGDGVTTTFDTSLLLRSGTGRVDNLSSVGDDFIQAEWFGVGAFASGDWNVNQSWIPNMIPNAPAGNAPIAIFGDRITSPQTVFTNATQTVNGLRFDNENKYAIGGNGSIALKANTIGGTVNPTIDVITGDHELQVAVSILNNTTVSVDAGAALDFNNTVALGGMTLTTGGAVNLNVGVTGGGAISNSGTLGTAGTTPIAANLTSTGTLEIDLGVANTDRFNVTGAATLSGLLDVVLEPGFTPTGSYTVLTSTGALSAAGLALHPSDAAQFSLGVSGNSLILTVGGGSDSDLDDDGDVDGNDFLLIQRGLGTTTDAQDITDWRANFGMGGGQVAAAGVVPEPASLSLGGMALAIGSLMVRRRAGK